MKITWSARERRLAAIVVAAIVVSGASHGIVAPLRTRWLTLEQAITDAEARRDHAAGLTVQQRGVDEAWQQRLRLEPSVSDDEAMAALLRELHTAVQATPLRLVSLQPRPPRRAADDIRYAVELQGTGSLGDLRRLLEMLVSSSAALLVTHLRLSAEAPLTLRWRLVVETLRFAQPH